MERNSAKIVRAHGLYAIGDFDAALSELERVDKLTAGNESYDSSLRVVANAVEGKL